MIIRASQIYLIFVLSVTSIHTADNRKSTTEDKEKPIKFIEESSENQISTTIESTTIAEELTSPVNVSREFRPSVQLGEIKESRINTNPFNDLQHFKIENTIDPNSLHEHLKDYRVIFQPNTQTLTQPISFQTDTINSHQNSFQIPLEDPNPNFPKNNAQSGYIKFENDASNVQQGSKDQSFQNFYGTETEGTQYDLVDPQVYQNQAFDQETYLGKPSKFQEEKPPISNDPKLHYANQNRPATQNVHSTNSKNPSNGMVYVQESTFMRTRKFPYSMWPQFHPELNDSLYPIRKKQFPWRKILHVIGAFLPLGLLIAALTPNVVKVDNATQPNIVLSKWRVADLPAEHKRARFTDTCEERSICEMILAGGDAASTALQNVLWNLATRTSSTVSKESLLEIFESVRKKDCSNVPC